MTFREGQKTRFARTLRRSSTDAEQALWSVLRGRNLAGWKFRRQVPIGPFVADFACLEAGLVIEVDGGQHADAMKADQQRSACLAQRGYRVLRFWNHDVLTNLAGVIDAIHAALPAEHPHPGPLPQAGEGEQHA